MGFRYVVESEAARLNLEGWVRNRRDGAVEAVVAGSDETVTAMIEAWRRGPVHQPGRFHSSELRPTGNAT